MRGDNGRSLGRVSPLPRTGGVVVMVVVVMVMVPVCTGSVTTPRIKHVQHQRGAERQSRARRLMAAVRQFNQQRGDRRVCVAGRFDCQRSDVAESGHLAVVGL